MKAKHMKVKKISKVLWKNYIVMVLVATLLISIPYVLLILSDQLFFRDSICRNQLPDLCTHIGSEKGTEYGYDQKATIYDIYHRKCHDVGLLWNVGNVSDSKMNVQ